MTIFKEHDVVGEEHWAKKGNNTQIFLWNKFVGDPVNSIDLSFDDDRVWGIQMTLNNKSIIYGYIIAMVDDDEIDKANNDEDYEMQETIYTASDFPNFSQLIQTYVEDNKNN